MVLRIRYHELSSAMIVSLFALKISIENIVDNIFLIWLAVSIVALIFSLLVFDGLHRSECTCLYFENLYLMVQLFSYCALYL